MRRKFYVMFVFCFLVLSATGLFIFGEPQEYTLPSRNTKPKNILKAAEPGVMAKLISKGTSGLSEIYMISSHNTQSAVNVSISTGTVIEIAVGERGLAAAGFKSKGIRNTGITPWKNVTVTVKADISHVHNETGRLQYVRLDLTMYKNGERTLIIKDEFISAEGGVSLTTPPFTIETNDDWHFVVLFLCFSNTKGSAGVAGTIREVNLNSGK